MNETILMELAMAQKTVNEIMNRVGGLSGTAFMSVMAMVFEEYCLKHHVDVVEVSDLFREVIAEVNAECGRYSSERMGLNG